MNKKTFSLTALHEKNYKSPVKLPSLRSKRSQSIISERLLPHYQAKRSEVKEVVSNIHTESSRFMSSALSGEMYKLKSKLNKLESTETVKLTLEDLSRHVLKNKTKFNKLANHKNELQKTVERLKSTLDHEKLKEEAKNDNYFKYESLRAESERVTGLISVEKQYTDNLRQMIYSRKNELVSVANPTMKSLPSFEK